MGFFDRLWRNVIFISAALRTLRRLRNNTPNSTFTTADYIREWAAQRPNHVAIYFENRTVTYKEWDNAANRYARWAVDHGVKKGDVVALLMENRPEFLFAWVGLARIGAISALINTNLHSQTLAHCLITAKPKHLILGAECAENYISAAAHVNFHLPVWVEGGALDGARDLSSEISAQSSDSLPYSIAGGFTAKETCFYIFTSGTTGRPKAARLTHYRVINIMNAFSAAAGAKSSDRIYIAMPLYHSAGGVAGLGTTLTVGGSIIIRRQFSVAAFWDDCVDYEATMFQYIGEICRYLLNYPQTTSERRHKIRVCVGNGLRPDIWQDFKERFRIPKILEFYGATEGNVLLFNFDGKPGAIGRVPGFLRQRYRLALVKFDVEAELPIRDENGFCIEADIGEVGECLGEINEQPRSTFEGYSSEDQTQDKKLTHVFKPGDAWFSTGDLMTKDKGGYFYFVDRVGDTFRWKGENVSTSEVSEVLTVFDGVKEANVYGVHIPHTDGRAGMAALVVEDGFDLAAFYEYISTELPSFSQPLFLRLQTEIHVTETFKQRKVDLVKQGFDPSRIADPLYFLHLQKSGYVPMDDTLFKQICAGAFRF